MHRLLHGFLLALSAHGLAPEALDPWRGWVIFKHYARETAEVPDPGVSVQFTREPAGQGSRLVFLRQVIRVEGERLEPVGGMVCEFSFALVPDRGSTWDEWSFEHPTFERFVDAVERHPSFQELVVRSPEWTAVYWQEASG
jgi:hypothetical protein